MNSLKIARNIIRRLLREPFALILIMLLPLLGVFLSIYMFNKATTMKIAMANIKPDDALITVLQSTGKYSVEMCSEQDLENMVKDKKVKAGVMMPNFTGNEEKVKLFCLGRDSRILELSAALDSYIRSGAAGVESVLINQQKSYSEESRNLNSIVGFLLMCIFMFAGSCMAILLEDKNHKTFMRMCCTPLRGFEIALGNLLASLFLGAIQIAFFLFITIYVLNINFGVNTSVLFVLLFFFFIASVGINIALAGLLNNSQALGMTNFILAGCMSAMGGCFVPVSLMTDSMKKAGSFIPQKWAMEAFEKLNSGSSLADIQINLVILILFAAVFFTFGVKVLRPAEDEM